MLKGFKDFIFRGNVVELAVAVVIGAAFGTVVTSFVTDILTPFISGIVKLPDFSNLAINLGAVAINYGVFLNAVISFLMVALAIYFAVVVPMNKIMERTKKKEDPTTKDCKECLSEVPLAASRCKHCAQPLNA